jgi:lipoic acid synthetase
MVALLSGLSLHTVCQEADCPNIGECFRSGTATFLILGRVCTRNCRFCAVEHGTPSAVDPEEPQRVSDAALRLGLRHVVITSVTRDDLPDGGASQFADSVEAIRRQSRATVELLVPDMAGDHGALLTVVESAPEVLGHNVEVVPRLYPQFRSGADYGRSLALLARVKRLAPGMRTKSSLMVGVGETEEEVCATLRDLRAAECDLLTIGQYLRPSLHHAPVAEYVAPGVFDRYAALARELGFGGVLSGPFVRSSYCAASLLQGLPGSDSR